MKHYSAEYRLLIFFTLNKTIKNSSLTMDIVVR